MLKWTPSEFVLYCLYQLMLLCKQFRYGHTKHYSQFFQNRKGNCIKLTVAVSVDLSCGFSKFFCQLLYSQVILFGVIAYILGYNKSIHNYHLLHQVAKDSKMTSLLYQKRHLMSCFFWKTYDNIEKRKRGMVYETYFSYQCWSVAV